MQYLLKLLLCLSAFILAQSAKPQCHLESSAEEAKKVEHASSEFAINLYKQISSQGGDKNVIVSPISITLALALLESGAHDTTRYEITKVLTTLNENVDLSKAYASLQRKLFVDNRSDPNSLTLKIANGLFPADSFQIVPEFVERAKTCFASEVKMLDFFSKLDESREIINRWVADKTSNKIHELLEPTALDPYVAMVLVNVIYFKGMWKNQFGIASTTNKPFNLYSESGNHQESQQVPFMSNMAHYEYAEGDNFKMLQMDYNDKNFAMYIVLPNEKGGLGELEKSLDSQKLINAISRLKTIFLRASIPKFAARWRVDLKDVLSKIGLAETFGHTPRFERMTTRPIWISKSVQEAFIDVTESGTEAGAASSYVSANRALPAEFLADHPFLYFIMHKPTGSFVFIGKVKKIEN